MLRYTLSSLAVVALLVGSALGDDKAKAQANDLAKDQISATIVKVDPAANTMTVRIRDKDGKETERVLRLSDNVRYLDDGGKVVELNTFKTNDEIWFMERNGQLRELHRGRLPARPGATKQQQ